MKKSKLLIQYIHNFNIAYTKLLEAEKKLDYLRVLFARKQEIQKQIMTSLKAKIRLLQSIVTDAHKLLDIAIADHDKEVMLLKAEITDLKAFVSELKKRVPVTDNLYYAYGTQDIPEALKPLIEDNNLSFIKVKNVKQ